jgi:aldose 1-epimerase
MPQTTSLLPASGRQVKLRAGGLELVLAQVGASLRTLVHRGHDVLAGYGEDELALYAQGQALVPWPNRLAGGRYKRDGAEHQLPLTEPEKGNAIHGLARWLAWDVLVEEEARAVLGTLVAPQAGYPYALRVEVEVTVKDAGVVVRTTGENVGRAALPFGAGFHPYLRVGTERIDDVELELPAATRLELDDRGIPTGRRLPVEGTELDFRTPRRVGDTQLDTAFGDLARERDGRARVRLAAPDGERAVSLWLDDAHPYVMAFTGDTLPDAARRRRSLGVEPMTCPPNALATGEDLHVLAPGEATTSAWGLELE